MPYSTPSEVNTRIQYIVITTSSNPSQAEVVNFITDIEADMNGRFRAVGIATPVTDPDSLEVVKPISIMGTIGRIYRSLEGQIDRADSFTEEYEVAMKRIVDNPTILLTNPEPATTPGYSEEAAQREPTFKRDEVQW